jgi:hypothetical protein
MEQGKKDTYNGWTNYETWAVSLWVDNEPTSYQYWRELALTYLCGSQEKCDAVRDLAEQLKQQITDEAPTDAASLYSDLLMAAISEVNWSEITENWIDENWTEVE